METDGTRTIQVDYLARVEGEGALYVKVNEGRVEDVKLNIFEPPRFFEAFLRDRSFREVPDITARICGICPVAYQMGSAQALESACGVTIDGQLRDLRHLLYCGEWIESHALHVFMLHAPDFLGYQDAIAMAKDHPDVVNMGLRLKKAGNEIMNLLGGREIHPINVRVGGFYRLPEIGEMEKLKAELEWAREASIKTLEFCASLDIPQFERDYEFVALRHPEEYAIMDGQIVSSKGIDIPIEDFLDHFEEFHVPQSTSLHAGIKARGPYLVGPMARYNLNFDRLSGHVQELALANGLEETCFNPFKSILIRSVELIHACATAIAICDRYLGPGDAYVDVEPVEGEGTGCTEAPRGICWHHYAIGADGLVKTARIIPPTSQNQPSMELDMRHFVQENLHLANDDLQWKCEQGIRNYDPCISCSCHFLKLDIERT